VLLPPSSSKGIQIQIRNPSPQQQQQQQRPKPVMCDASVQTDTSTSNDQMETEPAETANPATRDQTAQTEEEEQEKEQMDEAAIKNHNLREALTLYPILCEHLLPSLRGHSWPRHQTDMKNKLLAAIASAYEVTRGEILAARRKMKTQNK
jgi:hypothetical protein